MTSTHGVRTDCKKASHNFYIQVDNCLFCICRKRSSFLVWCHEHIEEHQQKREDGMGSLKMCCVVRGGQGVRLWSDQSHGNSPLVRNFGACL